jgi:hypothetical protein
MTLGFLRKRPGILQVGFVETAIGGFAQQQSIGMLSFNVEVGLQFWL